MAYNFIHRILNAEIPPPESSWDKIAATLDTGGAPGFIEKLSQAVIEPPVNVWHQIVAALDATRVERKGALMSNWMRWSAAAIIVGIIVVSVSYFFSANTSTKNIANTTSDKTNVSSNSNGDQETVTKGSNNSKDTDSVSEQGESTTNKDRQKPQGRPRQVFPVRHAVIETAEADNSIQLQESQPNISDNVSPAGAKYIPPPDYYVVTAPNGERTKISIKFSNAVASLMGGDNDNVDYLWKSRFDYWKSKLISNPTFIPAAGNFLDIAELNDLIKEQ
jgi:hypothetical protein